MASWANLVTSTLYTTLLTQLNDRDVDSAKAFDPAFTTVTAPVTNHVRYNSANKRWETYNGTAWVELILAATDAFNHTVTGVRGGNFYGTITNNGTISGGVGNFATLQVAASAVWTAASLTNLSQLTNGPSYLVAASLTTYALLAAPALTGIPTAPTAAVNTNTTQLATTAFVVGQGYATSASLSGVYAPLGGAGVSGTWGISVTGNSATTTQRTFSNVRTDAVNRGSYGTMSVAGVSNTYAGIDFTAVASTFMDNGTSSGLYRNNTAWDWRFDSGVLAVGAVPWARVTGSPSSLSYFSNDPGYINASQSCAFATTAGSANSATTALNVSGTGVATVGTLTAAGLLKGNSATSGNNGIGAVTLSTTAGARAGMIAGDIHIVY